MTDRLVFLRSIVTKNILLFLLILLVVVSPLAVRYDWDSRMYEIQNLASKLEFFAERGVSWIDPMAVQQVTRPEDQQTSAYGRLLVALQRIEREFDVDDAVLMRRGADGRYTYVAIGHAGFNVGQPVHIHRMFPATYKATNDTWLRGAMMHSQLFGGKVGDIQFDQFLQVNTPLKVGDEVVAILMLNKFANPVAQAVREKTTRVTALSTGLLAAGLVLFAFVSSRMLRPLKDLTSAAGQVAEGNLAVTLPPPRSRDEVGRLTATFRGMVEGLRQRDFIRDTFGRYVTREVVDELLGSPDGLRLGGEARVLTILVTDLRGFTALAGSLTPQEVLEILNRYLERMLPVIRRHRGTIDEIQGDGILVFFGAPLVAADDPIRAVRCALEMQLVLAEFNAEQRRLGLPELAMGIGINTGEVIVGNIGSEQRTKYAAVGSAINLAYRIESHTVGGQILLSPETFEHVRGLARVRGTVTAEFKGVEHAISLYDVNGFGEDDRLSLPEPAEEVLMPVEPPLPVACFFIEGKTVSRTAVPGSLVRLRESVADLVLETPVEAQVNLKIVIDAGPGGTVHELYAKVLATAAQPGDPPRTTVRVGITSAAEDTKTFLRSRVDPSAAFR